MHTDRTLDLTPSSPPSWGGPPGVSFSEALVEALLLEVTAPGDVVLDSFVGFGTTMVVADRLGRRGIGIELLPERVEHVRGLVARPSDVHCGDARDLERFDLPTIDASLSSPPYRTRNDHPQDPLDGYRSLGGDYDRYLEQLAAAYRELAGRLAPGAPVLIDVATMRVDGVLTDLAGDLASRLEEPSSGLELVEAVEVVGEVPASWMVADVVLVCRT